MATYDVNKLTKLGALKQLAERVKSDYATKQGLQDLADRVGDLESAGGEANVIEGVKINGTLLSLTDKLANILVAEGKTNGTIAVNNVDVAVHGLAALAYKSEVAEADLATALKKLIASKAAQSSIDTLTGTGDGSISKMIDDAFNDFSTKVSDDGVVNSYKELIDYVAAHGSEAATMTGKISSNTTAIANLAKLVGSLPEDAVSTDVVGYIAEAINALGIGDYAKTADVTSAINTAMAGKVDKEAGKGLSSNDYTNEEKTRLAGLKNYTHPSHTAKSSGLYKVTVDALGHVSAAAAVEKSDITALGIPGKDTTYSPATAQANGLMSAEDKSKLDDMSIATTEEVTTMLNEVFAVV